MLEGILEGQMNPHFSPIYTLKNLGAHIDILAVPPSQPFTVDGVTIRGITNPHGTTTALAYRLEEKGRALVYASDVGYPSEGPAQATIDFYRGADLLIHDCTYSPEDRAQRIGRGLSSFTDAADAAARAGVKHLAMFHYDQDYGDDVVDEMAARCRVALDTFGAKDCQLTAAREGLTITV
jgi:ribonuclease BN (tRNA processing enzyme)